jgi:hypothetical protein
VEERKTASVRILKRIFSFPVMLSSLLIVLAVLTVRARFDDPDMWWHLKMGQIIWTTHSIPTIDLFSYTTHHHAWIPHEWLAQVTIFLAYQFAGYSGVMLWLCFFTAAVLIAGYALCTFYSGNAKVALVGALVIWLFATTGLSVRPQMIGYLLLITELLIIHFGRTRNPRWFFALPVLFAVWINCHGSFILGLLLACALLFSSFFDFQAGSLVSSRWDPRCRKMLVIALVVSAAALFLNPVGIRQVLYPLDTMLHQPINLSSVAEWKPVQLNDGRGLGLMAVLLCIFLLVVVRHSKLYFDELILLVLGTWLGASHERMLFVFGILAAPILSRLLAPTWDDYDPEHDLLIPNAMFIITALLISYWAFPNHAYLVTQAEEQSPVKAVEFIKAHHLSGNMLNDYVYGGYLIWIAPEYPVFIDGRADVFEWSGVLGEFSDWATLQTGPDALPDKYAIDFCLLTRGSPMARVLPLLPDWKTIYSDNNSVILQRTHSAIQTNQ